MRRTRHLDARALVSCCGLLMASAAFAALPTHPQSDASNRIYVTDVAGSVDVTMAGLKRPVDVDTTVALSARIVTGSDGSIGIRQALTAISVAPNTDVEIPEAAVDGQLIARLVQRRGNVFYDVQQRDVGKLRVETPYLVAVVKGTQFNVAVQDDTATISLYEGSLQIGTPDGSESVDIQAGEIAIRSGTDSSIRVLSMNADELPQPAAGRVETAAGAAAVPRELRDPLGMARSDLGIEAVAEEMGVGESIAIDSSIGLDLRGGVADTGLGAGIDLGSQAMDLGLDTGLDLGTGSADIGLDTGLDLGAASADIGLDAGLDVGAGSADIGLDAGLDLGAGSADVGLDAGLDLGAGSTDVGLDAGLDLGGAGGTGVDTEVDLDVGDIGLGVDVSLGDEGLDADIDLGGDDGGTLEVIPEVIDQIGGLLGGIL